MGHASRWASRLLAGSRPGRGHLLVLQKCLLQVSSSKQVYSAAVLLQLGSETVSLMGELIMVNFFFNIKSVYFG